MQSMLKERRDWVNEQKSKGQGRLPEDMKLFYEKFDAAAQLQTDDDGAKRAVEEEELRNRKKKDRKKDKKKQNVLELGKKKK